MRFPPFETIRRWTDREYAVTTDPACFSVEVATAFLARDSYWAQGRDAETESVAAAHSRCYSVLHTPSETMVGGARAVTDWATFAWIADVFVVDSARGDGLGKFLMACVTQDLVHVQRLFLGTRDAHGLYAQYGFVPTDRNDRWMERVRDQSP